MILKVRENPEGHDAMAADFAARAATAFKLHQRTKGAVSTDYLRQYFKYKDLEYKSRSYAKAVRERLEGVQ